MPGSTGTGYPLTLRCSKCKRGDYNNTDRGTNLRATGRTRPLRRSEDGVGCRCLDLKAEYECLDCGHRGWSKHQMMGHLLRKAARG